LSFGSDHPSGPTLHFNFVGVFDRVAALGALAPGRLTEFMVPAIQAILSVIVITPRLLLPSPDVP
jgi:hypothetical protein